MRTLASLIQNGGAGKSTLAKYLAEALASLGFSVLLVDCDAQGSLTANCGIPRLDLSSPTYLGSAMLTLSREPDKALAKRKAAAQLDEIMRPLGDKLDIIPASDRMYFFEEELSPNPHRMKLLGQLLALVSPAYHFAILDGPPHLGPMTHACIAAASKRYDVEGPKVVPTPKWTTSATSGILVPVKPLEWALRAINIIQIQIEAIADALDTEVRTHGLVVTDYKRRESGSVERMYEALTGTEDAANKRHALDVLATIPKRTVIRDANEQGQLLFDYDPNHDANQWFADLALTVAGIPRDEFKRYAERDRIAVVPEIEKELTSA